MQNTSRRHCSAMLQTLVKLADPFLPCTAAVLRPAHAPQRPPLMSFQPSNFILLTPPLWPVFSPCHSVRPFGPFSSILSMCSLCLCGSDLTPCPLLHPSLCAMLRSYLIEEDTRRACARDGPKLNAGASCAFVLRYHWVQRTAMDSVAAEGQVGMDL